MPTLGQGRRISVTVVPQTSSPVLDAFKFDLTRSMTISYSGDATRHPVQNGAEGPVDMIVRNPASVSVSGLSANTPVIPLAGFLPSFFQRVNSERMISLTKLIVQLHQLGILTTVFCSWHEPLYNYWPSVVDLNRDQTSGNTIPLSVNFTKFRIVNTQTVPAQQDSDILALTQSRVEFGPVGIEGP